MKFKAIIAAMALVVTGHVSSAEAQNLNGWFKLQTMFQAPEGKCFEGNRFHPSSTLGGAAFMDDCQNVSGQLWKFEPAGDGYYRMKTMFQEPEGKCFEGNRYAPESTLGGAAFMDDCQNVSGQLWRVIPDEGSYVRLTTMFQEGEDKCLEGNRYAPGSTLGGAAFMDDCQNVSGQLWLLTPSN